MERKRRRRLGNRKRVVEWKALWVKESITNTPPFTHDLLKLTNECGIELNAEQLDFLVIINSWNIRGRYPDYTKSLHQNTTPEYVKNQMHKVEGLKKWLKKRYRKRNKWLLSCT